MGISGVDQATSLDVLVMQAEVISYIESVMRDLECSPETLAVAEIDEAAAAGTFIDRLHTAEHFRKELWFPRILDRQYYQAWRDSGAVSLEQRCRARTEDLLASHHPPPLPADIDTALTQITAAARRELR